MRLGRPKVALILTDDEQVQLTSMAHWSRTTPHLARRARIVLPCAEGQPSTGVAKRVRVSPVTVCKWRVRFLRARVDGLHDEPRPGTLRRITDEQIEQVIVRTRGATHWSSRGMAKASGVGRTTVQQIWRAFGLQPHRSETFKLSPDPLLIEKVRDIVGLYMNPPAHAVVFCVDEKAQIQALDRTQPLFPLRPGQAGRRTHDYRRHGTMTLFAALNVKTSTVITQFHRRHRAIEFRQFLDAVDAAVPRHLTSISSWTTMARTRPPSFASGWPSARASTSISPRPTGPGSISWKRWFAELTNKQLTQGGASEREAARSHHP